MKTLFIYSDFESLPKFFVLDGDYRHLDAVVINNTEDEEKSNELNLLICNKEGKQIVTMLDKLPKDIEVDYVVNCGFAL